MENPDDDEEDLVIDREILESFIKRILTADPDAADLLAHLFVKFKKALGTDLQQASQLSETLRVAIELIYLQTEAHTAALELYNLYQRGELLIRDYPLDLIHGAIERSKAANRPEDDIDEQPKEESDSEE
jgi:hypothetical protein